jgi:site-specific DNA recombinase
MGKIASMKSSSHAARSRAPLGYDIKDRKLVINEAEAATVRALFQRFIRCGSMTKLVAAFRSEGMTKGR